VPDGGLTVKLREPDGAGRTVGVLLDVDRLGAAMLGRENELWLRDGRLKPERELPELLRGAELKLGRPE